MKKHPGRRWHISKVASIGPLLLEAEKRLGRFARERPERIRSTVKNRNGNLIKYSRPSVPA
jgi:hypothetical protein